MTVLDSSAIIDHLLDLEAAATVERILVEEGEAAAPDVLTFEVLAAMRREVLRGALDPERARAAIDALGDLSVQLFPTLPLRARAWELRENLTAADALFVSLAEALGEPLATKDRGLARAAARHSNADAVVL